MNTLSGGGFINGIELPLLKNRSIDPKRAKLYQAEIERRKVEPTILKQRISLYKDAAKVYWGWVAAGQQLFLYDSLVKAVEFRQKGLEELVQRQALRAVDLVDFERILLSRQMQQIGARRRFQQAAIELSLYARDDLGMPAMPPEDRLPYEFPPAVAPDPDKLPEDFEVALRLRPEIQSIRLQARKAQVELGLAENQLLPSLNLYIYTEQDVGNQPISLGPDKRPFIMESSLLFDVPLQRRYAKGRIIAANAEIRQINMQAQYACDRVKADVLDARAVLQAAHDQLARTRDYLGRSRDLLKAEVVAVREGVGTVLTYNLREQAVYDALVSEVEAEYKFHAAAAEYRAALGLDAASNLPEPPPTPVPPTAPETWSTRPRPGQPATRPPTPSMNPGR
ncbi:MAG: TolC family protein [Isosphaeraceae bacterium]